MNIRWVLMAVMVGLGPGCWVGFCDPVDRAGGDDVSVEQVVRRIQAAGKALRSYRSEVVYEVNQPELETKTVRRGWMAYQRQGDRSRLRVEFLTVSQDDLPEQAAREIFLFDGVWLTHVNYDAKSVTQRQLVPEGEPADAMVLAGRSMPIVGFTDINELSEHCVMARQPKLDAPGQVGLTVTVLPDSPFSRDYTRLTFLLDSENWLPKRVVAETPVGDIHTLTFAKVCYNEDVEPGVFTLEIPAEFGSPEVIPLEGSR